MKNMEHDQSDGLSPVRRQMLQERLEADGGWLGLFSKLRSGGPEEASLLTTQYAVLAATAVSGAERAANAEVNQARMAATGQEHGGQVVGESFMKAVADGMNPADAIRLQFSVGMHLVAYSGQPPQVPGQE